MTNQNFVNLVMKVRLSARKNAFHILISYFIMSLVIGVVSSVFFVPVLFYGKNFSSLQLQIFSFAAIFFAATFYFLMNFGFFNMLYAMQREKFVTLGFLFNGFRKINASLPLCGFFSGLLSIVLLGIKFSLKFLGISGEEFLTAFQTRNLSLPMIFVLGCAILIVILFFSSFIFSFYVYFDEEKKKKTGNTFVILRKSASLMHKKFLKLIGFSIVCGGRNFIAAIVTFLIYSKLSSNITSDNGSLSVLVFFIEFIYIVNAYSAFTRIMLSVPFYYSHLKYGPKDNEKSSPTEDETIENTAVANTTYEDSSSQSENSGENINELI